MGEELDSLSLKELQNLEHQLETALKHIRSRKVSFGAHLSPQISCKGEDSLYI